MEEYTKSSASFAGTTDTFSHNNRSSKTLSPPYINGCTDQRDNDEFSENIKNNLGFLASQIEMLHNQMKRLEFIMQGRNLEMAKIINSSKGRKHKSILTRSKTIATENSTSNGFKKSKSDNSAFENKERKLLRRSSVISRPLHEGLTHDFANFLKNQTHKSPSSLKSSSLKIVREESKLSDLSEIRRFSLPSQLHLKLDTPSPIVFNEEENEKKNVNLPSSTKSENTFNGEKKVDFAPPKTSECFPWSREHLRECSERRLGKLENQNKASSNHEEEKLESSSNEEKEEGIYEKKKYNKNDGVSNNKIDKEVDEVELKEDIKINKNMEESKEKQIAKPDLEDILMKEDLEEVSNNRTQIIEPIGHELSNNREIKSKNVNNYSVLRNRKRKNNVMKINEIGTNEEVNDLSGGDELCFNHCSSIIKSYLLNSNFIGNWFSCFLLKVILLITDLVTRSFPRLIWKSLLCFAILYNCVVIPLKISFSDNFQFHSLNYLDSICDVVYILDCMWIFFDYLSIFLFTSNDVVKKNSNKDHYIPINDRISSDSILTSYTDDGINIEKDELQILLKKMKSKLDKIEKPTYGILLICVISSLPSDLIATMISNVFYFEGTLVRTLELCRIFRLLRIVYLIDLYTYWEAYNLRYNIIDSNNLKILKLVCGMYLAAHVIGCLYYYISYFEDFPEDNRWVVARSSDSEEKFILIYVHVVYWAIASMTGIGAGSGEPLTILEHIFSVIVLFIGVTMYATLVGNLSNIIASMNSKKQLFLERMEILNDFCEASNLPLELQERLRNSIQYSYEHNFTDKGWNSLAGCPTYLRKEVMYSMYSEIVRKVKLFKNCDGGFIRSLIVLMKPQVCLPGDLLIREGDVGQEMYLVISGKLEVIKKGQVIATISSGNYVGEVAVLYDNQKRIASVKALTYCDLLLLTKSDLDSVVDHYPFILKQFEEAAKSYTSVKEMYEREKNEGEEIMDNSDTSEYKSPSNLKAQIVKDNVKNVETSDVTPNLEELDNIEENNSSMSDSSYIEELNEIEPSFKIMKEGRSFEINNNNTTSKNFRDLKLRRITRSFSESCTNSKESYVPIEDDTQQRNLQGDFNLKPFNNISSCGNEEVLITSPSSPPLTPLDLSPGSPHSPGKSFERACTNIQIRKDDDNENNRLLNDEAISISTPMSDSLDKLDNSEYSS